VQLSQKFEKKAQLQDAWLDKMEKAITELDTKETDTVALRAALQRQEALAADVSAHDERVQGTAALGDELVAENYNAAKVCCRGPRCWRGRRVSLTGCMGPGR
jgi:hypothetical protein